MRSCALVSQRGPRISVLAASLVVTFAGCQQDAQSPTAPEPAAALAAASSRTLMFLQVSAGATHTCGVTVDSLAYCWGFNSQGAIGDGTSAESRYLPTPVAGGHRFSQVSVGLGASCGVTLEKKAYCWGRNDHGQLGDGSFDNRFTPVAVLGGHRFREVTAGTIHTCGIIDQTDRAYCWGYNNGGGLGDGTLGTDRATPVLVLGGLRWRQLSGGNGHTCGVTMGSRGYCWGNNGGGQLGDGTTLLRLRPTPLAGSLQFRQVTAGGSHSCGVTTVDRAYCWGFNGSGQLGDGGTSRHLKPFAIASQRTWNHVSAGYEHTCALTLSQRAWCWGNNGSGRLGDGTTTDRLNPVLVGKGMPFRQVTAGTQHSCGVSRLRPAYCWGANSIGQVGVIPSGEYPEPVPVMDPR
jgi:alpha-tubulin suppressor-like RCC1 family protein